jgi:TRAP-type C4-dicarboxylate transport system permease small subunit
MRWFKGTANLVGGGLFLTLFVVFMVQMIARFGFNKPMAWTDEAAVILYLGHPVGLRRHGAGARACGVRPGVEQRGPRTRQVMRIVGNLLIGGLALAALPATWDYVQFMHREGTPVLGLPFMWVFLPFVILMMALVVRAAPGHLAMPYAVSGSKPK